MPSISLLRPTQLRWLLAMTVALVLALCGLGWRLVVLQVVRHEELRALANSLTQESVVREADRGDILDVNGNPLATSFPVKRVCADPGFIVSHQVEVAQALAPLLGMTESDLTNRLRYLSQSSTNGITQVRTNRFVDLRFEASMEQWQQITQAMAVLRLDGDDMPLERREKLFRSDLRKKAIFAKDSSRRVYPNKELGAHVVGVVGISDVTINGTWVRELVGVEGIEHTFNVPLSGVRGIRMIERDRMRRELIRFRGQDVEPVAGLNVVLTLDLVLQKILEAELEDAAKRFGPANAMGIIVRPGTGEILAMANQRTFDPNDLRSSPLENRRNHLISDFYEPGSTFKVIALSAALGERVARLTDVFDCENGHWTYGGLPLTDHERYGMLPLELVFAKSSNIGIAKMALRLPEASLFRYVRNFGFGSKTGIDLPGEAGGKVRDVKQWTKLSMTRVPIGYEIAATPLQMTMAVAAVANQGVLMHPQLVKRLQRKDGQTVVEYPPTKVREVISPETARQVIAAMRAVASTNGTGTKAMLDQYSVAGKTGTAWKWNTATKHYDKRYYSSFIGFFPTDQPELCISIIVDDPTSSGSHYGSAVAAPVFRKVAEQAAHYLKIVPDRGVLSVVSEEARTGTTAVADTRSSRPRATASRN